MAYLFLVLAILFEVVGTASLKLSEGFTRTLPVAATVIGYGAAFLFLGLSLKSLNLGFAYAIWSGVGIVILAGIGVLFMGEKIDLPGFIGISLILAGVVVLNGFSKMSGH